MKSSPCILHIRNKNRSYLPSPQTRRIIIIANIASSLSRTDGNPPQPHSRASLPDISIHAQPPSGPATHGPPNAQRPSNTQPLGLIVSIGSSIREQADLRRSQARILRQKHMGYDSINAANIQHPASNGRMLSSMKTLQVLRIECAEKRSLPAYPIEWAPFCPLHNSRISFYLERCTGNTELMNACLRVLFEGSNSHG